MNKFIMLLLVAGVCFGQKITVADLQLRLKAGASEELLYGFAAGDKILLTIEETSGSTISEVAVLEYPESYKYRGYNIKKEKNREFKSDNKSVFKFIIKNESKEERSCQVKIQRIPANSDSRNFNSAVKWTSRQDTVYNSFTKEVVVGYDTIFVQKTRKKILFEKRYEELVLDKNQRVESKAAMSSTKASVSFSLPQNYTGKDETKKVIAWAYWVGVGEESNEFWKQNRKLLVGAAQGAAALYSPLGGIAAGAVTNLILPTNGEDVEYALVNEANSKLFFQDKLYKHFDNGKGIAAYKRFVDGNMLQGKYFVVLANDNYVQPIDVNVKVSAILEHIKFRDETYTDKVVTPRYETKIMREPQIITKSVPVTSDYK